MRARVIIGALAWVALLGLGLAAQPATAQGAAKPSRHVAVVLDTSGSMDSNDKPRLAIQAIKIIADMLGPQDLITVAWMPGGGGCQATPDQTRRIDLKPGDVQGFKQLLEQKTPYNDATNFIVPLATAREALLGSSAQQKLLIVISDDPNDGCQAQSDQVIAQLRAAGVKSAAVALGTSSHLGHHYDSSTTASNSAQLLSAIGTIYQAFLGAKAPASGQLSPGAAEFSAEVAPFVAEAFVLVAAEGSVSAISPLPGNPGATGIDADFRADQTRGLDGTVRGYRILRLRRPAAGTWRFRVDGLSGAAGWYLIQDFSVSMRFTPPTEVPQGAETPLTLELVDNSTGQRIDHPGAVPGLQITTEIAGTTYAFRDDGGNGDAKANDGVLTARVRFPTPGPASIPLAMTSRFLQEQQQHQTRVLEVTWTLDLLTPTEAYVGQAIVVAARPVPAGSGAALTRPSLVTATLPGGGTLALRDDGQDGDSQAGDGIYGRTWTPTRPGDGTISYRSEGGGKPATASSPLAVHGTIAFGKPGQIDLGRLTSGTQGQGALDLGFVNLRGDYPVRIAADFSHHGAQLQIDLGQGFVDLGSAPQDLLLTEAGARRWPLRVSIGDCPAGVEADRAGALILTATDHQGQPLRVAVPIRLEVVKDPWLHCWWPVIAAVLLTALTLFTLYGIISPARFPRSFGLVLSPEKDMSEGYLFNIRTQPGSGSGFYRDARMYITTDYQVSASGRGALARLRADRMGVFIQPLPGNVVLERNPDGDWETVSTTQERRVRFSTLYRNQSESLYFEFRHV